MIRFSTMVTLTIPNGLFLYVILADENVVY